MVVILIGAFILLNKTTLGRHIYATGGNEKAAVYSGINTRWVRHFVYILSGTMAAVNGITLAARAYSGNPIFGTGVEMDAIAACALGGMGLGGGNGYIGGTIIGAVIIGVLNNGLNLMRVNSFWQTILRGVVILAAMYVDYLRSLRKVAVKI
jgi:ribose transport system permease protein